MTRWRILPWKSGTAGTVAIEYGLVLPVLLLFTFGIMDTGRLLWTYITLTRATEVAARCEAINPSTCPSADNETLGLAGITLTPSTPSCGVQVVGTYPYTFFIPFLDSAGLTLTATACYPFQSH